MVISDSNRRKWGKFRLSAALDVQGGWQLGVSKTRLQGTGL